MDVLSGQAGALWASLLSLPALAHVYLHVPAPLESPFLTPHSHATTHPTPITTTTPNPPTYSPFPGPPLPPFPTRQVIYIAPLKALVRERIKDWGQGFCRVLGKRMVELTGDYTPDMVRRWGGARAMGSAVGC